LLEIAIIPSDLLISTFLTDYYLSQTKKHTRKFIEFGSLQILISLSLSQFFQVSFSKFTQVRRPSSALQPLSTPEIEPKQKCSTKTHTSSLTHSLISHLSPVLLRPLLLLLLRRKFSCLLSPPQKQKTNQQKKRKKKNQQKQQKKIHKKSRKIRKNSQRVRPSLY
jgi:hypothetical protein